MTQRILAAAVLTGLFTMGSPQNWEDSGAMTSVLTHYNADQGALNRKYPVNESHRRYDRYETFYQGWLNRLDQVDFDALPPGGRADWVILNNRLRYNLANLGLQRQKLDESLVLVPFWPQIEDLLQSRVEHSIPEAQKSAQAIDDLRKAFLDAPKSFDQAQASEPVARRAYDMTGRVKRTLQEWYDHYAGYDPLFTWWCKRPFEDMVKALDSYRSSLNNKFFGGNADADTAIKGDPIGTQGFQLELQNEMVGYTVEQLIEIGKQELAWCDQELIKASRELGFGDDWKAAMEHVKTLHPEPGGQPAFVYELAEEAIQYLEKNDLLTVPDLAKETWRSVMMSPQRQLVSPFFLGGETIWISFPTDTMTHEQKLMSMRANNRYFSKATVHHELIPGHHIQQYMASRYNPHRRGVTNTPFWTEGWALYWEFYMYRDKFAATPEERMGFLFWRKHRAARIVFSLSFHLGQMTADECIEMLVEEVRHERSTAEGEVRRSLEGSYPPLYQAAYMLGAFQLWDIRRQVVDTGKMTDRQFHDAVLQLGNMPWAITKALLTGEEIPKTFSYDWDFYKGPIPSPW